MIEQFPVGVFDSGVGGLSVYLELKNTLPHENFVYVADSANVPYGDKSAVFIQNRSLEISRFLIESHNVKAIVVACNTATASAIELLRKTWPKIPFIGMEPALKPALSLTNNKKVGVLATVGTLKSARFSALLEKYTGDVEIFTQAAPGLVEHVEAGDLDSVALKRLLKGYIEKLLVQGVDVIVLGCTHYPFLKDVIRMFAGDKVLLVDTGLAVARQLKKRLGELNLLNLSEPLADREIFYSTAAAPVNVDEVFSKLLGTRAFVRCRSIP